MNITFINQNGIALVVILVGFSALLITLTTNQVLPVLAFFLIQIFSIVFYSYSIVESISLYSFLIIYGGGVLTLFIIFIIFTQLYRIRQQTPRGNFQEKFNLWFPFFIFLGFLIICNVLWINVTLKQGMVYSAIPQNENDVGYFLIYGKSNFRDTIFEFLCSLDVYGAQYLNSLFLGQNIINLIFIGFWLCVIIWLVVSLLSKYRK